jgi:hypothetical protein
VTERRFEVKMPAGGTVQLHGDAEVDLWTTLESRYKSDYRINKINDLVQLGMLLMQNIALFRAQRSLAGISEKLGDDGLPTGEIEHVQLKDADVSRFNGEIRNAAKEIRDIERAMGIDKRSREAGGDESVRDYLTRLKRLAHDYGLHVNGRVKALEEFAMELKWRLRVAENGDAEDRTYMDCTPDAIMRWARDQLDVLEENEKVFARHQNALIVGQAPARA